MEQRWYRKDELQKVAFNCGSSLGVDILACDCIKGLWYFTLDERPKDATYFGPYRNKEAAERVARTYTDNWKKRLWYL